MANTNYFQFGANADPLLGNVSHGQQDYDAQIRALRDQEIALQQRRNASRNPVWDKVDAEVNSLTDMQQKQLNENEEYQMAAMQVQEVINREFMRMIKPAVEATEDGRKALENQLNTVSRLKRKIVEETEQKLKAFEEWQKQQGNV